MPRLTVQQVVAIIRTGRADGIGVFAGLASGGLEMIEAEGRAHDLLPKVREAAERLGVLPLLERLAAGCVEKSPSGGVHFVLRVTDGPALGNTVLAARPDATAEHGRLVLFETRGQGGWFVCAPSAGRTHKSGRPYRLVRGGPSTIPTFTAAERDALYAAFRAVDEMPAPQPAAVQTFLAARRERPAGDILPGDDFNERATWDEILVGWTRRQTVGDRTHWTRPGKEHGTSATTTAGVLCCFSSSVGLPVTDRKNSGNGLSKFATYAHLHHRGDFAAAARDLWNRGYGSHESSRQDDDTDGGQLIPVEPRPTPTGPCRDLADWRQEAAARRGAAVAQPGLHMDRSPTGSGKTYATNAALARASSSLTVLPTHANVVERVQEMRQHGIDAVAFPELTTDNCRQFDAASHAQSLGLVAGAAVCPTCPFKEGCAYRAAVKAAEKAAHRVATHERLRRSSRAAHGVQVVVIDETPETVLAPTVTVTVGQLGAVDHLAHGIRNYWHSEANPDQKSFARAMQQVVADIHDTCKGITTAGTVAVALDLAHQVPPNWQRLLYDSIRRVGVGSNLDPAALALVTKAAAGELTTLQVVTDLTATGRLVHFVVGSWRPATPAGAAVILLDATGSPEDIAAVVGQPVDDCTPAGHLPLHQPVVQVPDDISRGTAVSTVAGQVEAFLAAHPEVQRLGIIGHKPHLLALVEGEELAGAARQRLAKSCWFGQGPDRASNDWHQTCDHLLVLGTPRANPGDYRRWLVQHGLHDAARKPDGDWGPRDWEAVGTDGQPVTVHGMGYRDPDWHRAYVAVCRSTLHQSVGRGRSILPDGIPVTVLTAEPTTYPVGPSLATQPAAVRETVEIVLGLGQQPQQGRLGECAKNPIESSYREICASGPWRSGDCIQAIMAAAGVNRRAAEVRLADCRKAGLLVNPRKGWWGLPGSEATTASDAPQPASQGRVDVVQATVAAVIPAAPPPAAADHRCPRPVPAPAPAVVQPPVQAVVIAATGPVGPDPAVDVVAGCLPAATTATCTSTTPQVAAPAFDDLVALIDERAAIMEHDGGLDRETADRLAREMVLGRDAVAQQVPAAPAAAIVATADHVGLAARSRPYVDQVLRRIPGTVRVIDDQDDPFAAARARHLPARPGACRCGCTDAWVQVSIHGGQSVRVDCRNCDRFGWFATWYGKRLPSPWDNDHDDQGRVDQVLVPVPLSAVPVPLSAVPVPLSAVPVNQVLVPAV